MKILGLWFPLGVCVLCICFVRSGCAQEAGNHPSSQAKPVAPDSDWLTAPVAGGAADRMIVNLNSDRPDSSNDSCATMRTYRVKRRGRDSEAVGPAGYTTCVPMRRFEMRSTVEPR
jgi:hypothetical protein